LLLRARRKRPRRRRAAEQRDELASSYAEHRAYLPSGLVTPPLVWSTGKTTSHAVGLPHAQRTTEGTAGLLGRSEMF
jgi:hypothetical protein